MDIHSFFGASTSSTVASSSTHTEKESNCSDSYSDIVEPPSKKACRELIQSSTTKRKYSKNCENEFRWRVHDEDINGAFRRVYKHTTAESTTQHTGGVWVTKMFQNWKKATERMKAHERSSLHTQASPALLVISKQGSVVQQLQKVCMQEGEKNRAAMKSLVCCTHFLTRLHIAHSTNFTQLVDLVASCGARELQVFVENSSRNALLEGQWLTLSKDLEHGSRSLFWKGFKRYQFLVLWPMSAYHDSWGIVSFLSLGGRWHSCRILFGHCAFTESRCWEHIFSTCQVYQRQKSSG